MSGAKPLLAALTGAALCLACPAAAQDAPAADAQTLQIVEAADAFLATLDDAQRQATVFAFDDAEQRVRWSNLPEPIFQRAGARWGDLDEAQRGALMDLLGAVLSPDGVQMMQEQMAADDDLMASRQGGGGGPGSGGGPQFGSDYYFVSFLGEPSATEPWVMQFGGHHLAINAAVHGARVSLSPSLTGGQPIKFTADGRAIYIVEDEVNASVAMLGSLTDEQLASMIRGEQRIDLVLGPGKDGMTLQPEGLAGRDMTDAQKQQFLALIKSRLGILNADDLETTMAPIRENIDDTTLAWFGPTTGPGEAYFRITGPTLLIEFSPQGQGGRSDPTQHLHSMYREPGYEYGAAWAVPE